VCVCVCVFVFCIRYRKLPTQRVEAWLFSLLINIQCERFVSLSLYFVFILFLSPSSRFPTGPHYLRVFSDHCFHYHPLIFSCLFLSHMLFQSHSFWQHTLASDQVLACFLRTFVSRESLSLGSAGFSFGLSSKWTSSAGKHEPRSSRSRFRPCPSGS